MLTCPLGDGSSVLIVTAERFRIGDVSTATGATRKALLGYEALELVVPERGANGYRTYDAHQVDLVREIRTLNGLGIPLENMRPFIDCLGRGNEHADSCPATLSEYRRAIERLDDTVRELQGRRAALVANLTAASERMIDSMRPVDARNENLALPSDLPPPVDDGAADGLVGRDLPAIALPSTDDQTVELSGLGFGGGRALVYVFPMTGEPGRDMPEGWDSIPGARGCSSHNCDIRNHYADLVQLGVDRVYGLSSQSRAYQSALVDALRLPYPLLTDEELRLADDPGIPTLSAGELTLFRRCALLVRDGVIEHVFYPIFPPDQAARAVLDWLAAHPAG